MRTAEKKFRMSVWWSIMNDVISIKLPW